MAFPARPIRRTDPGGAPGLPAAPHSRSRQPPSHYSHSGADRYDDRPSAASVPRTSAPAQRSQSRGRDAAPPSVMPARSRSTARRDRRADERAMPPPPPVPAHTARYESEDARAVRPAGGRSRASNASMTSASSASSGASGFLERMRVRSADTTPRTSIDDDAAGAAKRPSGGWAPQRRDERDEEQAAADPAVAPSDPAASNGDGSWLWSTVSSAANSLTINVSRAWASGVPTYSGEETPPGGETRLTRALKAYHLERARSKRDLPDWLFDASERRVESSSADARSSRAEDPSSAAAAAAPRARGLRDIYAAAASEPASAPAPRRAAYVRPDDSAAGLSRAPTKAADRLRAMREAKRPAARARETAPEPEYEYERAYEREPAARATPPPRVGLPTGPSRRRG